MQTQLDHTHTHTVDFQLFLLAVPLALIAAARPRLVLLFLGLATAASATYTVWAGSAQGWTFQMIGGGEGFVEYHLRWYTKPWTRAIPSLIGMAIAVVLFCRSSSRREEPVQKQQPEPEPEHIDGTAATATPPVSAVAGSSLLPAGASARSVIVWAVAFALIALATEGSRGAYSTVPSSWTPLQFCLYLALSRLAWGVGLALLAHRLFLGTHTSPFSCATVKDQQTNSLTVHLLNSQHTHTHIQGRAGSSGASWSPTPWPSSRASPTACTWCTPRSSIGRTRSRRPPSTSAASGSV